MADDRHERANPGLSALLGNALRESAHLMRMEFALLKAEVVENVQGLGLGIGLLLGAGVFAIATVLLLLAALALWLATVVGSGALAALIVAAGTAVVAVGLGLYGRAKLSATSLTPERTVRSVGRDAALVTERLG